MPEDDTTKFQRSSAFVERNKGKIATAGGGGLTIGLALMLFATKGELEQINVRQTETHRQVQDIALFLMGRADATNNVQLVEVKSE